MVREEYEREGAVRGPHQPVEFVSEAIELDIPKEGITCSNGWKIIPLISPTVSLNQNQSIAVNRIVTSLHNYFCR